MHGTEPDLRAKLIYTFFIFELARPGPTVRGIVDPLCPVTLWPALLHCDPVVKVRRMPLWNIASGGCGSKAQEAFALKLGISDCMLHDEPSCLGSIVACY